jgi:hypothetical protein
MPVAEGRKIIDQPVTSGLFAMPKSFTRDDEVIWAKVRMDAARLSSYQDSKCGPFPNTFDSAGSYLCGGRKGGGSSPCNKLTGSECLIRLEPVKDINHSSCMYWETTNAGDMEVRYCSKGKLDDKRISFGTTPHDDGFGCERCEYGQHMLLTPDSEGRKRWCALKGMPVEDKACCAENEPIANGKSSSKENGFAMRRYRAEGK